MHTFLPSLLKKIGYQEKPDENDLTKCLRQEVAKWACALGNSDCRSNAIAKLEWHFANPEKHKYIHIYMCVCMCVCIYGIYVYME